MASVTLKDIAQALGLSISTVSRALRDSYEINPETRRLVMEYAEKLHYQPNPIALSLKDHRSRSIGVIVPEIANTFFSEAINGIEDVAYGRGYHVVISQTHEAYEREVANAHYLASRRVDGLIVSLSSQTTDLSHFSDLHEKGWPLVFFDRVPLNRLPENLKTHTVVADNAKGAYAATVHLLQAGCRAIAHLAMPPWMSISTERLEGYRRALSEYGVPYRTDYVRHFEQERVRPEEIGGVLMEWMQRPDAPDAILGASDRLTVGCL
ncbi:MAG: LacI family DNA-binding transcriptional regulator, partial [Sphingobacteriaceae bacterium]|nr:LacI family DNA-binding transcriptional regulator [Cytophagaceae bacterium]